jgi:integrase/recombinase XerC/integrase/recombinase XerD
MSLALLEYDTTVQESIFDSEDLIERFIAGIDVKTNSKDTYKRQIKPFFEWVSERYSFNKLHQMNQQDIFAYKEFLVKDGKSAYTISGYLTVVRKFRI